MAIGRALDQRSDSDDDGANQEQMAVLLIVPCTRNWCGIPGISVVLMHSLGAGTDEYGLTLVTVRGFR
ncbi:hypothetical protein DF223_10375 [Mycetocola zhujimingii]|uniref:Uncharacterized protein n=1 Tax=Mycetocola zhujimingii TaxID=2079792 RepID=A0A2U1TCP3_9MICO|nr:hypothetical protein DF223_10375 [Mycetocola zhujimingii]